MTIELGLLLTAAAGVVGVSTFLIGRQSAAKHEGERWGKMEATLLHMQRDIRETKDIVGDNSRDMKVAIRRAHERLDAHLRDEHGVGY
jgi:hypothetical protein